MKTDAYISDYFTVSALFFSAINLTSFYSIVISNNFNIWFFFFLIQLLKYLFYVNISCPKHTISLSLCQPKVY